MKLNIKNPTIIFQISHLIYLLLIILLFILGRNYILINILFHFSFTAYFGFFLFQFFKDYFKDHNLYQILIFSLFLGQISFTLIILFLGHLGINISRNFIFLHYIILSLISLIYFSINAHTISKEIQNKINISKQYFSNHIIFIIFNTFFFFLLTLIILNIWTPYWDHFTFWLLDAKSIYSETALRTTGNLMQNFSYSSFYPLQATILYHLFGDIREQYVSIITIFYGFIGSNIALFISSNKKDLKFIIYTIILIIVATLTFVQGLTLSYYADVIVSTCFSIFFWLLLNPKRIEIYQKRVFLLSLLITVIGLIKHLNIYYSILLLIIWIVYDYKLIKQNYKKLNINKIILYLIPIIILFISRWFYTNYLLTTEATLINKTSKLLIIKSTSLITYFQYTSDLIKLIINKYFLIILYIFGFLLIFFNKKKYQVRNIFLIFAIFIFPSINIAQYIIRQKDLASESIIRYITTIFFTLPIFIKFIDNKFNINNYKLIFTKFFYLITILVISILSFNKFNPRLTPHDGRYENSISLKEIANHSKKIKSIINNNNVIIIQPLNNKYSNMYTPSIYYRYFLSENYIGGQYMSYTQEKISDLLKINSPDYIFIINPDNYLKEFFSITNNNTSLVYKNNEDKYETVYSVEQLVK